MKANEFIREDANSIRMYLTLSGINLADIEYRISQAMAEYKNNAISKIELEQILFKDSARLAKLLADDVWKRLIDDPDRIIVLRQVVSLFNTVDDYIKSI